MWNNDNQTIQPGSAFSGTTTYDDGLRAHMIRTFNTVAAGLAVSGATAFAVYSIPALQQIFLQPMVNMIIGIGLLAFLWVGMNPNRMMQQPLASVQVKYYIFTALMGTTLSYVFVLYAHTALLRVFFITAATFGAMSLYGYSTKRNLTGMASFMIMGLVGIIIASIVNIFLHSSGLSFGISILGVLIFTGLIAYQAQAAKRMYSPANGDDANNKLAIINALGMYINFINLFQTLLRFTRN